MSFTIMRSASPGCEPNCPEWIVAEGQITAATSGRFRKILKAMGKRKLPLIIRSPGGQVDPAIAMGRMIRKQGLDVAVAAATYAGCKPADKTCKLPPEAKNMYTGQSASAGANCSSACTLVLASGTRRLVGLFARAGVHDFSGTITKETVYYRETYRIIKGKKKVISRKVTGRKKTGSYTTSKLGKAFERKVAAYLKDMGMDATLLPLMRATPASGIHYMTAPELMNTKLATGLVSAEVLTDPSLCRVSPPAPNCVLQAAP